MLDVKKVTEINIDMDAVFSKYDLTLAEIHHCLLWYMTAAISELSIHGMTYKYPKKESKK